MFAKVEGVAAVGPCRVEIPKEICASQREAIGPVKGRTVTVKGCLRERRKETLLNHRVKPRHLLCYRAPIHSPATTNRRIRSESVRESDARREVAAEPVTRCQTPVS